MSVSAFVLVERGLCFIIPKFVLLTVEKDKIYIFFIIIRVCMYSSQSLC